MKDFHHKVAVITGAASGIGRSLANRFAAEGMRLVLADIETEPLQATDREIRASGAEVLTFPTDVSNPQSVDALARAALDRFGAVHVLCNNAGVWPPVGPIWERSVSDWEWTLSVNVMGVVNGIRTFVPILLEQQTEAHIVNTASVFGLMSYPFVGPYIASKHAIIALSETLASELEMIHSRVKISILCPGEVRTRIMDAARNRPVDFGREGDTPEKPEVVDELRRMLEAGMSPEEVAEATISAIRDERLYILTHPKYRPAVDAHFEAVSQNWRGERVGSASGQTG